MNPSPHLPLRSEKLFATGELNPLEPGFQRETVVDSQGGSADAWIGQARPTSLYLTGGVPLGPVAAAAPRFTEEKSTRIKREYPLDVFAAMHLTGGKRHGSVVLYPCPAHGESPTTRSPHLEVYQPGHKKSGFCKCYRCGFGGTVIDLAMQVFGVATAGEAMNLIEGKSAFDEEKRKAYAERSRRYAEIEAARPRLNQGAHVLVMADWAATNIETDARALAYLRSRGLGGAVRRWGLGSSTGMPDDLLPQSWDGEKASVYPMRSFRDRIVIPYIRPDGDIKYVNARGIGNVDKTLKYRKVSDIEPEPYLLDLALEHEDIVLTEGEFDALSLLLALKHDPIGVFAVPGVHCFTEADALKLADRRVVIVLDNDDAGARARTRLEDLIAGVARTVVHHHLPPHVKDLNALLAAHGRAAVRAWFRAGHERVTPPRRFL